MLNFANSTVGYKNWCFIFTKFDFEKSGEFAEISYSLLNKIFVDISIFGFFLGQAFSTCGKEKLVFAS